MVFLSNCVFAHVGQHSADKGIIYTIKGKAVQGHFLMVRDGKVFLELQNGSIVSSPLEDFSFSSQSSLSKKIENLKEINTLKGRAKPQITVYFDIYLILLIACSLWFIFLKNKNYKLQLATLSVIIFIIYACKTKDLTPSVTSKTDPSFIEKIYAPFKSTVKTRYDDTYFYVESNGIPTHNMMVGITSWQQQVPLPQNYTGTNAWSIPLKPEYASTVLSLKNNFMKGAVAIAPNGIPIFNPLNNRGEDAYAIGELDQWGGHCGRADDYHYHIAPLHFEATAGNNPIAMALDGFAIYGSKEPDGSTMKTLDEYHGHELNGNYHYHATASYPYFIASFKGKVSLDPNTTAPENQILPQAFATPIRPAGTPLKGASISNFATNGKNGYDLTYTIGGKNGYVKYTWTDAGQYTFNFIGTDGVSTTNIYNKK